MGSISWWIISQNPSHSHSHVASRLVATSHLLGECCLHVLGVNGHPSWRGVPYQSWAGSVLPVWAGNSLPVLVGNDLCLLAENGPPIFAGNVLPIIAGNALPVLATCFELELVTCPKRSILCIAYLFRKGIDHCLGLHCKKCPGQD